jgi:biopolymer transport protein ExbB/TolQ
MILSVKPNPLRSLGRELPWILGAAAAATLATYAIVYFVLPSGAYVYKLFYERSIIQHATTFMFWFTVALLGAKHRGFVWERSAYLRAREIADSASFQATFTWSDSDWVREQFTQPADAAFAGSMAFNRILHALDRLRKSQSTRAMEDYFKTRSEYSSAELETEYAGIRYCVWLIPTLGFLGTVWGIGVGIAGFSDTILKASDFEAVKTTLPQVTTRLGTAFDTTLLALIASAVAVFYMSYLLKAQEQLLSSIDSLCFDGICSIFQEHSTDSENIIRAIRDHVDQILTLMNGNRGAIENALQGELRGVAQLLVHHLGPLLQGNLDAAHKQQHVLDLLLSELVASRDEQRNLTDAVRQLAHASKPASRAAS